MMTLYDWMSLLTMMIRPGTSSSSMGVETRLKGACVAVVAVGGMAISGKPKDFFTAGTLIAERHMSKDQAHIFACNSHGNIYICSSILGFFTGTERSNLPKPHNTKKKLYVNR
ncbi:unnamed protein product [Linum trigynum]|uniref:Uncharacterized protein n=1 Tax=Linum trigynum TaxID=586398 RepID=A0AAV2ELX4_9ROSI